MTCGPRIMWGRGVDIGFLRFCVPECGAWEVGTEGFRGWVKTLSHPACGENTPSQLGRRLSLYLSSSSASTSPPALHTSPSTACSLRFLIWSGRDGGGYQAVAPVRDDREGEGELHGQMREEYEWRVGSGGGDVGA